MLFDCICSTQNGIQLLFHLNPIETLSSIQCFEIYSYLIGQSVVCHKIFINIIRLLLLLSTTNNQQSVDEVICYLFIYLFVNICLMLIKFF